MHKRTVTYLLFTSLFFFTSTGYTEENNIENNIEVLQKQITEAHSKIKKLQKRNQVLKKKIASKEKQIVSYRAKLEEIEAKITALKKK